MQFCQSKQTWTEWMNEWMFALARYSMAYDMELITGCLMMVEKNMSTQSNIEMRVRQFWERDSGKKNEEEKI